MKKSTVKIVSIILVAILLGGTGLLLLTSKPIDFPDGAAGPEVAISVAAGETGASIANDLYNGGVILTSKTFLELALKDSRALSISPGLHKIESHITSLSALEELLDPKRNSGLVQVTEGSTYFDVLKALQKAKIVGKVGKQVIPDIAKGHTSLEGLLFPATYALPEEANVSSSVATMLEKFTEQGNKLNLNSGFERYNAYQVLTIASLIQIEADTADFAKAARVIYNRLAINMPLQLNSTIQYANNTRGRIALSRKATTIQSPYNTYLHTGLPPTPISNPGAAAITAALHPIAGDWLYFITVKPHDTRFTKSFTEFQSWVTLYNNNLANGAFK
jgi:UPF0755 protein